MTLAAETADAIEVALAVLRRGGVVAFPTDTLYALGADAGDDGAVRRVFAVKKRPFSNPLPLCVADAAMAETIAIVTGPARLLIARFWPGALTLVVPRRKEFHSLALAGAADVALRAPGHPIALDLVRRLGRPLTATSANLSGGPDPTSAAEVRRQLGAAVDYVLDGGECPLGASSTIVDCTGADIAVVRRGAVAEADVRAALHT